MTTSSSLTQRVVPSPVGPLTIVASDRGVVAIHFATETDLADHPEDATHPILAAAAAQLAEYFTGGRTDFDLPLDLRGTEFQVAAWQALAGVPFGATTSYRDQARRIGRPAAVRAVGAANGRNPVPIVLPCHRIVGADGSLTGYAGGLDTKRWLLDHERDVLTR